MNPRQPFRPYVPIRSQCFHGTTPFRFQMVLFFFVLLSQAKRINATNAAIKILFIIIILIKNFNGQNLILGHRCSIFYNYSVLLPLNCYIPQTMIKISPKINYITPHAFLSVFFCRHYILQACNLVMVHK